MCLSVGFCQRPGCTSVPLVDIWHGYRAFGCTNVHEACELLMVACVAIALAGLLRPWGGNW